MLRGAGKSSVLGRIVTTADPQLRRELPPDDHGVRASIGAVSCATHVKGKTAREVAIEIARGASVTLPDAPEDLVPALREGLAARRNAGADSRFNLVVDALDAAVSPAQARLLVAAVLLPLAACGPELDAQVQIGTRPRDAGGDLLGCFEKPAMVIDLDDPALACWADAGALVVGLDHGLFAVALAGEWLWARAAGGNAPVPPGRYRDWIKKAAGAAAANAMQ